MVERIEISKNLQIFDVGDYFVLVDGIGIPSVCYISRKEASALIKIFKEKGC